jgi:hypothetical protein
MVEREFGLELSAMDLTRSGSVDGLASNLIGQLESMAPQTSGNGLSSGLSTDNISQSTASQSASYTNGNAEPIVGEHVDQQELVAK